MITAIVAYDKNRLIGLNGQLPWSIKEEMCHFKRTTINNIVIMGRKTFDSIAQALPERLSIIVSNRPLIYPSVNQIWATSIQDALTQADLEKINDIDHIREVFIIGGEQIYRQAFKLGVIDRVLASEIKREICVQKNDVANYFPAVKWSKKTLQKYDEFNIVEYIRA